MLEMLYAAKTAREEQEKVNSNLDVGSLEVDVAIYACAVHCLLG